MGLCRCGKRNSFYKDCHLPSYLEKDAQREATIKRTSPQVTKTVLIKQRCQSCKSRIYTPINETLERLIEHIHH